MTMTARILVLGNGKCAFIDSEDSEYINQWSWGCNSSGYAYRRGGNPAKSIYLHQVINKTPKGMTTDHINRNRLDNRKSNLRSVTWSENRINTGLFKNNTTGHKGVSWETSVQKWTVGIGINGKWKKLGRFNNKEDAIKARKEAELEHHQIVTRT